MSNEKVFTKLNTSENVYSFGMVETYFMPVVARLLLIRLKSPQTYQDECVFSLPFDNCKTMMNAFLSVFL